MRATADSRRGGVSCDDFDECLGTAGDQGLRPRRPDPVRAGDRESPEGRMTLSLIHI